MAMDGANRGHLDLQQDRELVALCDALGARLARYALSAIGEFSPEQRPRLAREFVKAEVMATAKLVMDATVRAVRQKAQEQRVAAWLAPLAPGGAGPGGGQ